MIIDFHTHIFPVHMAKKTVDALAVSGNIVPCVVPDAEALHASMQRAGVDMCVTLPVCTNPAGAHKLNDSLIGGMEAAAAAGLVTFGAAHPDMPDMKQELARLKAAGIPGIKLHPAFQNCDLDDPRMLRLIGEASGQGLIVLCHGGFDVSYPGRNFADVPMLLKVLREVAPEKLIMAHMGCWGCWDQVLHEIAGAPIWLDTAFCLAPVPRLDGSGEIPNMTAEGFLQLARAHGMERILFGTDSPWADLSVYVERLRVMTMTEAERSAILGGNAMRLLGLSC